MPTKAGLYFIQDASGPIKIGRYSGCIKIRMASLQTGNPRKLNLIHDDRECDLVNETVVHCSLIRHRIRSEWFHTCEDVLSVISAFRTSTNRMKLFCELQNIYKPPVFDATYLNKHGRVPNVEWIKQRFQQAEGMIVRGRNEAERFIGKVYRDETDAMMGVLSRKQVTQCPTAFAEVSLHAKPLSDDHRRRLKEHRRRMESR